MRPWRKSIDCVGCRHAHRGRPRAGRGDPLRPRHPDRGVRPHRLPDGRPAYRVRVCAARPRRGCRRVHPARAVGAGALARRRHDHRARHRRPRPRRLPRPSSSTRCAGPPRSGTRIASICSGAFVLAATGLLDGLRATTHWVAAACSPPRTRTIEVDPDVLYVDNGQILTSAGAAAGLDLCLHMIRRDYGSAVAADAARLSVMPLEREGGQAQFIVHDQPPAPRGVEPRTAAALDARTTSPATSPSTDIAAPRRDEHPHPEPALPRADRHHTPAVAAPGPYPPGPVPAGDHHALRRPHRRAGRLRLAHRLPRPLQARRRHQPARVPRARSGASSATA